MGWPGKCRTIHCNTPVCVNPATTMNSTPITTTDVELKPEHASSKGYTFFPPFLSFLANSVKSQFM